MISIDLQPVPSQIVNVQLGGQAVTLNVYQKRTGMFVDVLVAGVLIMGGIVAEDCNRLIRSLYLGFSGDLLFIDTQGSTDPYYTGLGGRYSLLYLSAAELGPGVG